MGVLLVHTVLLASPPPRSPLVQSPNASPRVQHAGLPRSRVPGPFAHGPAQRGTVWPRATVDLGPLFRPVVPFGPRQGNQPAGLYKFSLGFTFFRLSSNGLVGFKIS
jgi:hypothetical protein